MPQFFWIFLDPTRKDNYKHAKQGTKLNILVSRNHDSGAVETNIPDTETTFDWLDYHLIQCQAQSRFAGISRLYIGEISCILDNANRFPNHRTAWTSGPEYSFRRELF
jgi:hypothetical protein